MRISLGKGCAFFRIIAQVFLTCKYNLGKTQPRPSKGVLKSALFLFSLRLDKAVPCLQYQAGFKPANIKWTRHSLAQAKTPRDDYMHCTGEFVVVNQSNRHIAPWINVAGNGFGAPSTINQITNFFRNSNGEECTMTWTNNAWGWSGTNCDVIPVGHINETTTNLFIRPRQ